MEKKAEDFSEMLKIEIKHFFERYHKLYNNSTPFSQKKNEIEKLEKKLYNIISGGGFNLQSLKFNKIRRKEAEYWKVNDTQTIKAPMEWDFVISMYYTMIFDNIILLEEKEKALIIKVLKEHNSGGEDTVFYYLNVLSQELAQYSWYKTQAKSKSEMVKAFNLAHTKIFNLYHKALMDLPRADFKKLSPMAFEYCEEVRRYRALTTLKISLLKELECTPQQFIEGIKMGCYHYKYLGEGKIND